MDRTVKAPASSASSTWALALVVGAAVLLRFFKLAGQSFWFDEGTTLTITDHAGLLDNVQRFHRMHGGGERFQPLYNLVIAYWRAAFGDSEFALRSLSALCGSGAVLLVVLTARRVFGSAHALWTGVIAACSSYAIFYSQEARPYAFLLFFAAAEVYCLAPILADGVGGATRRGWRIAHAAVVLVGSFGSIFFLMFMGALSLAHLITSRAPRAWFRWWLPAALTAVPALVFYLAGGEAADPTGKIAVTRYGYPVFESLVFVLYGVLAGLTYGPSVVDLHGAGRWRAIAEHGVELAALALVVAVMGVLVGRAVVASDGEAKESRRPQRLLLLSFVIGLALATALAAATRVTWLPRHSYFLWVPVVLLAPVIREVRWPFRGAGVAALVAFVAVNVWSAEKYFFRYEYSKEDYRGIAHYVMADANRETPSVLVYGWARLLKYYGDTRTVDANCMWTTKKCSQLILEATKNAPSALVILTHEEFWRSQNGQDFETAIGGTYAIDSVVPFPNAKVYRLSLRKDAATSPP